MIIDGVTVFASELDGAPRSWAERNCHKLASTRSRSAVPLRRSHSANFYLRDACSVQVTVPLPGQLSNQRRLADEYE